MAMSWIKLSRNMMDNPIIRNDGLCRLWVYCLMRANWKPSKWLIPGTSNEITVARGSFITGRTALHSDLYGNEYTGEKSQIPCDRTLWRRLQTLEKMQCVKLKNLSNRCTLVTIVKYNEYQDNTKDDCPAVVPPLSSTCPAVVPPLSTIEERKNIRSKEDINTMGSKASEEIQNPEQAKPAQPPATAHAILEDAFRSTYKPLALVPLPDVLEIPAFREVWGKWCDYLTREKAIRYAQTTMQSHLVDLSRDGPTTAAERLTEAMSIGLISPAKRKQDKPVTTKQQQPDWLAKARAKNANKTT